MASQRILKSDLPLKGIQRLREEVFGHLPQLNIRTGNKKLKVPLKGNYVQRYYPESIEASARKATPGYQSALEERRTAKLEQLRRRGKGPPKKGSGKRQQKK